jgi:hemerythrin-like domain-containing protein
MEGRMNQPPEPIAGLIRDHRRFEAAIADARAALTVARAAAPLPAVQTLLEYELTLHIAKEEQVLFPALHEALADLEPDIENMLAEHDEIRERGARLGAALAALDEQHQAVRAACAAVLEGMQEPSLKLATALEQLDWVLQGHFTGEEDSLFLPAEELFDAAALAELERQMVALAPGPHP